MVLLRFLEDIGGRTRVTAGEMSIASWWLAFAVVTSSLGVFGSELTETEANDRSRSVERKLASSTREQYAGELGSEIVRWGLEIGGRSGDEE